MLAAAAAPAGDRGTASGFLVTCQQAGGAIGVAAAVGIQAIAPGSGLWGCACFTAAALLGSTLLVSRRKNQRYLRTPAENTADLH